MNASLSTVLSNYLTTQPVSISTANACIMNLSCTSIASRGNCMMIGNGLVYFNAYSNTLATTYTGARIVLWPGIGTPSSTDWYGIRMNRGQLVYNVPSGQMHSIQVNGAQMAYFNSGGLSMNGNSIVFSKNGAGIVWGNSYSQIYDNGNLYIYIQHY